MRALLVLLCFAFTATGVHAAYSNDSNAIDIDYVGAAPTPSASGGNELLFSDPPDGDEGGEDGGDEESDEESQSVSVPVSVVTSADDGTSPGAGGSDGEDAISADDILNTLRGNQAIFFEGGSGGGFGTVRIWGDRAREALGSRGITRLDVGGFGNKFLTKGDFAAAIASSVLENPALQEVVVSLESFTISYKAEGRLFAVFPMQYPVRLTINPYGATTEERVVIKLPWYRFFLQTFFSRSALQKELDQQVTESIAKGADVDARTRLYTAVTQTLTSRVDTVADSL